MRKPLIISERDLAAEHTMLLHTLQNYIASDPELVSEAREIAKILCDELGIELPTDPNAYKKVPPS